MYLEAKETVRLYTLLSDKLGADTTEAMIKYIDNKTQRALESSMQTVITKEDISKQLGGLRKEISETKADTIKWIFIFGIGQVVLCLLFYFF